MKKNRIALILAGALCFTSMAGCGKKEQDTTENAAIAVTPVATMNDAEEIQVRQKDGYVISNLTGEWIDESLENQRPVCIMINNIIDAMPQSGISQADITYEMLVEGGITRYMCVFKDYANVGKLGPVRSARHYYVAVNQMYDGIYAHVGWSNYAHDMIVNNYITTLNGLYDGTTFYRDETRYAPHNCYTDGERLQEGIANTGISTSYEYDVEDMFAFNADDTALDNGQKADKITTAYNSSSTRWFEYNADDKMYYRFQYGEKQIDDQTNEQLKYKNVIVMFVQYTDLGEGLQDVDWDKGGDGYYATDGEYEAITWKKVNGVIKYFTEDGNQLKMNPGNSFITVFDETMPDQITME
ncbi:MAG: DUF3048 domain-containing protein [Wujia sp.]